jgi:hypothetical protein
VLLMNPWEDRDLSDSQSWSSKLSSLDSPGLLTLPDVLFGDMWKVDHLSFGDVHVHFEGDNPETDPKLSSIESGDNQETDLKGSSIESGDNQEALSESMDSSQQEDVDGKKG